MSEWQPIETAPSEPMDVLLFYARAEWTDAGWNVVEVPAGVRYDIGYWRDHFYFHGSNHEVFEFGKKPGDPDGPTHWMPLPAPPERTPQ